MSACAVDVSPSAMDIDLTGSNGMSVTIELVRRFVCKNNHWMTPYTPDTELCYRKKIEVPDIESVRFKHTEVERGIFSNTVQTYDAVRYGDTIYRLSYDIKNCHWIGEIKWTSPPQSAHFRDFSQEVKEAHQSTDWSSA